MKLLCCFAMHRVVSVRDVVGFVSFGFGSLGSADTTEGPLEVLHFGDLHGERGSRSLSIAPKGEAPEQLP
jgi:hypothetical protein